MMSLKKLSSNFRALLDQSPQFSYSALDDRVGAEQRHGNGHFAPTRDQESHACLVSETTKIDKNGTHSPNQNGGRDDDVKPRVFIRRWFMLFSFCAYSFSNAYQWISLNIIGNLIGHYYNASLPDDTFEANTTIDMLSMIFMIAYIPLIFPATWLLEKKGLRLSCLLGCFLNALGAGMKCFAVAPERFSVLMVAQTLSGIAQVFLLGIPAHLAAVWFGPNEVSTATSIGVFGNQVGIAVGFLLPPILVKKGPFDSMSHEFEVMHYITTGVTVAIFVFMIIFFRNNPPLPPSTAQQLALQVEGKENYLQSLRNLFHNKQFVILMCAYGINTGSFYAISTLLNTVILHYHEGEEEHAGQIGLTLVLLGVVGAILGGIILDKTKAFKTTTIAIYVLTLAGMMAFTFTLDLDEIWIIYITAGSLGFFMTGYLPVGFEFAAEITYPESEGTSSGLLNMSAQIFGVTFTLGMRAMMESVSVMSANITICCCLLAGVGLTAIIKPNYRRQEAENNEMKGYIEQEDSFPSSIQGQPPRSSL